MTEPCKDAFSKAISLGFNSVRILEGGKHKEASEMQHGNRPSRPNGSSYCDNSSRHGLQHRSICNWIIGCSDW